MKAIFCAVGAIGLFLTGCSTPVPVKLAPKTKAEIDAEWKKVHEDYLNALHAPVDPKVVEENLRRNRERPPELTDAEKVEKGCEVAHVLYDDKPISQLTRKQLQMLEACESLGH